MEKHCSGLPIITFRSPVFKPVGEFKTVDERLHEALATGKEKAMGFVAQKTQENCS